MINQELPEEGEELILVRGHPSDRWTVVELYESESAGKTVVVMKCGRRQRDRLLDDTFWRDWKRADT